MNKISIMIRIFMVLALFMYVKNPSITTALINTTIITFGIVYDLSTLEKVRRKKYLVIYTISLLFLIFYFINKYINI